MKWASNTKLVLMGAVAAATGGASVLALSSLNGGGALTLGPVDLAPIAAGYDRKANLALATANPSPMARATAAAASRAAIAQYPYDSGAWLRLAYLDQISHGHLTEEGMAALARSYDLIAVEPDFGIWRVGLALENSQALPKTMRAEVRKEVETLWAAPEDRMKLRQLQTQLVNPAGRLSLGLWIYLNQLRAAK